MTKRRMARLRPRDAAAPNARSIFPVEETELLADLELLLLLLLPFANVEAAVLRMDVKAAESDIFENDTTAYSFFSAFLLVVVFGCPWNSRYPEGSAFRVAVAVALVAAVVMLSRN